MSKFETNSKFEAKQLKRDGIVPETSIKDQLKKLVGMQLLDKEIYEMKQELLEQPQLLDVIKEEFEEKKAHLNQLEAEQKELSLKRKDLELELNQKEAAITKHNAQLSELKTNKEYKTKLSEIESIKADKSTFEDKILESFEESEHLNKKIEEEKARVGEEEKKYLDKKKEVDIRIAEIRSKMDALNSQRNEIAPSVEKNLLLRYEQILENKGGLAIAPIVNNSCGGCHINITQQMINAIKMNEELVQCVICARILYIEDDL